MALTLSKAWQLWQHSDNRSFSGALDCLRRGFAEITRSAPDDPTVGQILALNLRQTQAAVSSRLLGIPGTVAANAARPLRDQVTQLVLGTNTQNFRLGINFLESIVSDTALTMDQVRQVRDIVHQLVNMPGAILPSGITALQATELREATELLNILETFITANSRHDGDVIVSFRDRQELRNAAERVQLHLTREENSFSSLSGTFFTQIGANFAQRFQLATIELRSARSAIDSFTINPSQINARIARQALEAANLHEGALEPTFLALQTAERQETPTIVDREVFTLAQDTIRTTIEAEQGDFVRDVLDPMRDGLNDSADSILQHVKNAFESELHSANPLLLDLQTKLGNLSSTSTAADFLEIQALATQFRDTPTDFIQRDWALQDATLQVALQALTTVSQANFATNRPTITLVLTQLPIYARETAGSIRRNVEDMLHSVMASATERVVTLFGRADPVAESLFHEVNAIRIGRPLRTVVADLATKLTATIDADNLDDTFLDPMEIMKDVLQAALTRDARDNIRLTGPERQTIANQQTLLQGAINASQGPVMSTLHFAVSSILDPEYGVIRRMNDVAVDTFTADADREVVRGMQMLRTFAQELANHPRLDAVTRQSRELLTYFDTTLLPNSQNLVGQERALLTPLTQLRDNIDAFLAKPDSLRCAQAEREFTHLRTHLAPAVTMIEALVSQDRTGVLPRMLDQFNTAARDIVTSAHEGIDSLQQRVQDIITGSSVSRNPLEDALEIVTHYAAHPATAPPLTNDFLTDILSKCDGIISERNEQIGRFSHRVYHNVYLACVARGDDMDGVDAKAMLAANPGIVRDAFQLSLRELVDGTDTEGKQVAPMNEAIRHVLDGKVYETSQTEGVSIDPGVGNWGELNRYRDYPILLKALQKTPNALKKKSDVGSGFLGSIPSFFSEIISFATGRGGSLTGGLGAICTSSTEFVVQKAIGYVEGLEISGEQKRAYVSILNEMLDGWDGGRGIRNAEGVSDYRNAAGHFAEKMAQMPPIVVAGMALPIFDPFVDLDEPHNSLMAGLNDLEHVTPQVEGASTEFSEVEAARDEFSETLQLFSVFSIYTGMTGFFSSGADTDPNAFSRIMREVLQVGGDEPDPAKRFAMRKEKFLDELVKNPLNEASHSTIRQLFVDLFTWFKKIPAKLSFMVCAFYIPHFAENGVKHLHEQLLKINEQNSNNPADQIDVTSVTNATKSFNHITKAMESWGIDPAGGESSTHIASLLDTQFGYDRTALYKEAGKLALKEYVPEFNLLRSFVTGYMDMLSRWESHNHFTHEGMGYIGNNFAKVLKYIIIEPFRLLLWVPYIGFGIFDKGINYAIERTVNWKLNDQNELLKGIVDSTRDTVTLNRSAVLISKQALRDKLHTVRRQLQSRGGEAARIPMAHPTREALKTMLASMRQMVIQGEHRTQQSLSSALQGQQNALERARIAAEEMASDGVINQITDVVAVALDSVMEESHINLRLSEGLRSATGALTGLTQIRPASNEDLEAVDDEIKAIREEIIKIIIDRATSEMTPGTEVLRRQGTEALRSPRNELLGEGERVGLIPKWQTLLNEYRAIPAHDRVQRAEKSHALHESIQSYMSLWMNKMTRVRTEHAYSPQIKAQFYREFADLNKLFVNFTGENPVDEMNRHLENAHSAMHVGQPIREADDLVSNLCHIVRAESLSSTLSQAFHATQRIRGPMDTATGLLATINGRMSSADRAGAIDNINTHLTAISHQIDEISGMQKLEDLRIYEERNNGQLTEAREYRRSLIEELKGVKTLLTDKMQGLKNDVKNLDVATSLQQSGKLTEIARLTKNEVGRRTGSTAWLQNIFSSSDFKTKFDAIKNEYLEKIVNEGRKQVLLDQFTKLSTATTETDVDQIIRTFELEIQATVNESERSVQSTHNEVANKNQSLTVYLNERHRRWHEGVDTPDGRINGINGLEAQATDHSDRLETLLNRLPEAVPQADVELQLTEIFSSNEQTRASNNSNMPRIVKHLIEKRVIELADETMDMIGQPWVLQKLLDEGVILPFAQGKGKFLSQPVLKSAQQRRTN